MRKALSTAIAAALLLAGCSGPSSVKAAREKVDVFHGQLDRAEYDTIANAVSDDIRNTASRPDFIKLLTGVHEFYGKVRETKQTGWRYNTDNRGSFSELDMQTTFERGIANEKFVFRNIGEDQKLAGYHVKPQNQATRTASTWATESAAK